MALKLPLQFVLDAFGPRPRLQWLVLRNEDGDVIPHSHPPQSVIQSYHGSAEGRRTAMDAERFKKCPAPDHTEPDPVAERRHTPGVEEMPVTRENVLFHP